MSVPKPNTAPPQDSTFFLSITPELRQLTKELYFPVCVLRNVSQIAAYAYALSPDVGRHQLTSFVCYPKETLQSSDASYSRAGTLSLS